MGDPQYYIILTLQLDQFLGGQVRTRQTLAKGRAFSSGTLSTDHSNGHRVTRAVASLPSPELQQAVEKLCFSLDCLSALGCRCTLRGTHLPPHGDKPQQADASNHDEYHQPVDGTQMYTVFEA